MCLNKCEYALIMSEYARMCLNNVEYDLICQNIPEKKKKQSTEYVRILNVSVALHSIRLLYKLLYCTEQLSKQRRIQNSVKYLCQGFQYAAI